MFNPAIHILTSSIIVQDGDVIRNFHYFLQDIFFYEWNLIYTTLRIIYAVIMPQHAT